MPASPATFVIPSWLRWLAWGGFLAAWTVGLLVPIDALSGSGGVAEDWASPNLIHVVGYALLTLLSAALPLPLRWRWAVLAGLGVHAIAGELAQQFVPTRYMSWLDVGLDLVGMAVGVAVTWKQWLRPRMR